MGGEMLRDATHKGKGCADVGNLQVKLLSHQLRIHFYRCYPSPIQEKPLDVSKPAKLISWIQEQIGVGVLFRNICLLFLQFRPVFMSQPVSSSQPVSLLSSYSTSAGISSQTEVSS